MLWWKKYRLIFCFPFGRFLWLLLFLIDKLRYSLSFGLTTNIITSCQKDTDDLFESVPALETRFEPLSHLPLLICSRPRRANKWKLKRARVPLETVRGMKWRKWRGGVIQRANKEKNENERLRGWIAIHSKDSEISEKEKMWSRSNVARFTRRNKSYRGNYSCVCRAFFLLTNHSWQSFYASFI